MQITDRDEQTAKFLEGVVGVVEATSYERHQLWCCYAAEAAQYGYGPAPRFPWTSDQCGMMAMIGTIDKRQIWVSLFCAEVNAHKLLFWHVTSLVADHVQCEAWLKTHLPPSALREDGYINQSDPMNFHNVFRR